MVCTEPLTLFHVEQDGSVTRFLLIGSWYETNAVGMAADGTKLRRRTVKARILAPWCWDFVQPDGYTGTGWTAKPGDYLVRGDVELPDGRRWSEIPRLFGCFGVVKEARDRRLGVEPHIYLEGE